jgi:hypothetical protein
LTSKRRRFGMRGATAGCWRRTPARRAMRTGTLSLSLSLSLYIMSKFLWFGQNETPPWLAYHERGEEERESLGATVGELDSPARAPPRLHPRRERGRERESRDRFKMWAWGRACGVGPACCAGGGRVDTGAVDNRPPGRHNYRQGGLRSIRITGN